MERFTISKSEKQTIYEIYRACRLCGAGGGYRMPIVQNIIDLDSSEVELRQKIQECLQLEVRPDDRMPPLICELCVDKLNDFYEFLELARQTNVKTRTRLGLPIETAKKGEPESTNCILGVTEPVYVKEDEAKKSKAGPKSSKIKKEPEIVQVKTENTSDSSRSSSVSSRTERSTRRAPAPRARRELPAPAHAHAHAPSAASPSSAPAPARRKPERERSKTEKAAEAARNAEAPKEKKGQTAMRKELQTLLEAPKEKNRQTSMMKELQTLLEDNMKFDDSGLPKPRAQKRAREEPPRPALLPKRGKAPPPKEPPKEFKKDPAKELKTAPVKEPSPVRSRPGPKSRKQVRHEPEPEPVPVKVPRTKKPETPAKSKEPAKPPPQPEASPPVGPPYKCMVCDAQIKASGAFTNHMRSHVPCFTKPTNACNPCGTWYATAEEAATHHRYHRADTFPYHCRRCFDDFVTLQLYDEHIDKGLCVQDEPPQVKCEECWAVFVSEQARAAHRCPGRSGRPGGKCSKCSRTYATAKTLKRHESQCGQRKTGDLIADPDVLRRLKPMRVRITRCDDLFRRAKGDHYDVSRVKPNYGLAKNYIYPYMKLPVKTEPLNPDTIVAIPLALKEELATDYTHWDSDDSDTDIIRKVPSLSTLAIKKLFSKNVLGKVRRKRKKVKHEAFENDDSNDARDDINDIINSLSDDMGNANVDRNAWTAKIKDIIGCLEDEVSQAADKTATDESKKDDKVCNDTESDESTKDNLIGSKERVDDNCEESSEVEASVSEQPSNTEASLSEERSNGEVGVEKAKENLIESKERVDNDNCEESSKVEASFSEQPSNGVPSLSEEPSNGEGSLIEQPSSGDASLSKEPSNIETRVNEEPITGEVNFSEEPSNREANVSEEPINGEVNISEEPSNGEANVSEEPINGEVNISEEPSHGEVNISEEPSHVETTVSEEPNNAEVSLTNTVLDNHTNSLDDENEKLNRIDMEINNLDNYKNKEIDVSLQNEENKSAAALELENVKETSMEVDEKDSNEPKTEEKQKESPIKHSIENLLGETDRNPDKYINEVISSIEDIIMNNSRTEVRNDQNGQENEINDRNLMDALDEQIGEKKITDNDKITLEDLLPKDNRHEELEDISDDDFNFDA